MRFCQKGCKVRAVNSSHSPPTHGLLKKEKTGHYTSHWHVLGVKNVYSLGDHGYLPMPLFLHLDYRENHTYSPVQSVLGSSHGKYTVTVQSAIIPLAITVPIFTRSSWPTSVSRTPYASWILRLHCSANVMIWLRWTRSTLHSASNASPRKTVWHRLKLRDGLSSLFQKH